MDPTSPSPTAERPLVIEVVDWEMAQVLREKTPAQRLEIAFGLWRFARATIRRRVAAEHPDWTQDQVYREATRRMLHDEVTVEPAFVRKAVMSDRKFPDDE